MMSKYVKGSVLSYIQNDIRFNTPQSIAENVSQEELREVYSLLREVARKRLKRLESQSVLDVSRETERLRLAMPGIKDLKRPTETSSKMVLAQATAKLRQTLEGKQTTLKEILATRQEIVERLRNIGVETVTENTVEEFGLFMEYARSTMIAEMYDSREVAEAYDNYTAVARIEDINIIEYFDKYFIRFMDAHGYTEMEDDEVDLIRGGRGGEVRRWKRPSTMRMQRSGLLRG